MNSHYAYLYDDFLSDKVYDRQIAAIETRCSVLGIQGRVARLAIFRSARELVEGLVKDGAETIVIVGNDRSVEKTMWFLPDLPVTVGYIPVCQPSRIATLLGIPEGEGACDVLAARRIESVDVGKVEDRYFLTEVFLEATKASVDIEGRYRVAPRQAGNISIRNLGSMNASGRSNADARDGLLEVVIKPVTPEERTRRFPFFVKKTFDHPETRITLSTGSILSDEPVDAVVDGHRMNGFTFRLGIEPRKLKLITGRGKRLSPEVVGPTTSIQDLPKLSTVGTVPPAISPNNMHGWRNWYTR